MLTIVSSSRNRTELFPLIRFQVLSFHISITDHGQRPQESSIDDESTQINTHISSFNHQDECEEKRPSVNEEKKHILRFQT